MSLKCFSSIRSSSSVKSFDPFFGDVRLFFIGTKSGSFSESISSPSDSDEFVCWSFLRLRIGFWL